MIKNGLVRYNPKNLDMEKSTVTYNNLQYSNQTNIQNSKFSKNVKQLDFVLFM